MKPGVILIASLMAGAAGLAASALAAETAPLVLVKELGALNGQAMACSEMAVAQEAKALMLAHAPKTDAFGAAFQAGNSEGFAAQTRPGAACPSPRFLAVRLAYLKEELQVQLPVRPAP